MLRCLGQRQLDKVRCPEAAGLCSKARPFAPRRAFSVQTKADRHANGSPFGGAGERSETERARPLTANPRHSDSIALTKSLPIAAQRLFPAGLALSVTFGATSPKGRGFGSPKGAKNPPWRSQLLGGFLIAGDESAGFSHFCLYYMRFSAKVKHCAESLQSLFSWHLLYLFGETCGIMGLRPCPPILWEGR